MDDDQQVARAVSLAREAQIAGLELEDAMGFARTYLEIAALSETEYEPMTRAAHKKLERGRRTWFGWAK